CRFLGNEGENENEPEVHYFIIQEIRRERLAWGAFSGRRRGLLAARLGTRRLRGSVKPSKAPHAKRSRLISFSVKREPSRGARVVEISSWHFGSARRQFRIKLTK